LTPNLKKNFKLDHFKPIWISYLEILIQWEMMQKLFGRKNIEQKKLWMQFL